MSKLQARKCKDHIFCRRSNTKSWVWVRRTYWTWYLSTCQRIM